MRPSRLIPLYLLLLFPIVAANRPTFAGQPQNLTREDLLKAIEKMPPGSTFQFGQVVEGANAQGVSGNASGDKATLDGQNMTPPAVSLPGATGQGGGGSMSGTAISMVGDKALKLLVGGVGILCLLGAALTVYLRWSIPRAPIMLAGTGLGLLVAAFYPGVILFVLLAAVACGVGYVLWSERHATRAGEALRAVVAGVSDVPADIGEAVRKSIKAHADEADKRTIAAVKFKDGLK